MTQEYQLRGSGPTVTCNVCAAKVRKRGWVYQYREEISDFRGDDIMYFRCKTCIQKHGKQWKDLRPAAKEAQ